MPAPALVDDAIDLAAASLGFGLEEGNRTAYRPGTWMYRILEESEDEEFDELTIEISGQSSILGETLAALDAVQLAFSAAVAAVEYRIDYAGDFQERGGDAEVDVVRDRLRALVADPSWELQILELQAGSFKGIFKAVTSKEGRKQLLGVAGIAVAVLTLICIPGGAVGSIVLAGAAEANNVADFIGDRMKKKQEATRKSAGNHGDDSKSKLARTADNSQLHRVLEDLEQLKAKFDEVQTQQLKMMDEIKVRDARIEELTIKLQKAPTAPMAPSPN